MTLMKRASKAEVTRPSMMMRRPFPEWPDLWTRFFDLEPEETAMKVEEFRENGSLVVRAELPGIDPEKDVEITVSDGTLHIHAERREEHKEEAKGAFRSEFRYGSFDRTLPLPAGTSEENVTATYRDGILEVRLPVDDSAAAAKRVPVTKQ